MVKTLDFEGAVAGAIPENPAPSENVFADMEPPAEAFSDINAKYGKQHTLLVLDTSGSMGANGKIDESNLAKEAFVTETAVPENKDGFLVTEITFNDRVKRTVFAKSAQGLKLTPGSASGGTDFEAALLAAKDAVQKLENQPNPDGYKFYRPVVIFMSDGHSHASDQTINAVKEMADIICIAFGTDANTSTLAKISTDGQVHKIGTNGGELRKFLASVGKTLSDTHQATRI